MPQNRFDRRDRGRSVLSRVAVRSRVALCAAAAAAVLVSLGSVARAGDDDESLMTKFMSTLGLRAAGPAGGDYNYSERSPLVVPPSRNLPPPETSAGPPVPNWPKDADMRRRAEAKVVKKVTPHPDNVMEDSRPLRPDELNVGRTTSATNSKEAQAAGSTTANSQQANPAPPHSQKSIFNFSWFKKEEYVPFTGEPTRAALTDPPPGYQTPSPDQPYGLSPDKKKQTKVPSLAERADPVR